MSMPDKQQPTSPFFSVSNIASYVGVSTATIYRMIARGTFRPGRLGKQYRATKEQVDALIRRSTLIRKK